MNESHTRTAVMRNTASNTRRPFDVAYHNALSQRVYISVHTRGYTMDAFCAHYVKLLIVVPCVYIIYIP